MNSEFKSRKSVKSVKSVVESVEFVESVGACPASCCPVQILQQLVSSIDPELAKSLVGALVNKAADAKKKADAARLRRRDELLQLDRYYKDEMKKMQNDRSRETDNLKKLKCKVEELNEEIGFARNAVSIYDKVIRDIEAKLAAIAKEWHNGGYDAL